MGGHGRISRERERESEVEKSSQSTYFKYISSSKVTKREITGA